MKNNFIQIQDNSIIFDKNQLVMSAGIALAVVVVVLLILFAVKSRKRNFIKTIPTNLKSGE